MNWRLRHFVLSDFYISYQPLQATGLRQGEAVLPLQLTTSSAMLAGSEPVYVAILGRPAGFINWLLSRLGFLRRLEFVLTQRQAIYSLTSVSGLAPLPWTGSRLSLGCLLGVVSPLVVDG